MEVDFHELLAPLLTGGNFQYKVIHGGRGGIKSWGCAMALIARGSSEKLRILCAREIQKSMKSSVHKLLCDMIERLGQSSEWTILNDKISNAVTGSTIEFVGLFNNTDNVKSYESVDICWVEEAASVSSRSWEDLLPTIRKEGSEVWVTFNPRDELDPTYQLFVANPREDSWVLETSYKDNIWMPSGLRKQMEQCKKDNYKLYLHVWEGQPNCNFEDALIQPEWVNAARGAHTKLNWEPLGARITSFDPADTGDNKALATRHGFLLEKLEDWSNDELPEAILKAYQQSFDTQSQQLVYDADGMGVAMKINLDRNEKEYLTQTVPFHGGGKVEWPEDPYPPQDPSSTTPLERVVKNKDTFRNLRAQKYSQLRDRFQNTYNAVVGGQWIDPDRCISISDDIDDDTFKRLRQELTGIQRKPGESGTRVTLMSKQEMRSKGIKSPNLSDAVMMAWSNVDVFTEDIDIQVKSQWS